MFVEVVRKKIERLPHDASGWLAGLRDRNVAAGASARQQPPASDWTIDGLAREAGLSRSAFADRFAGLVGVSPMQFLARWRMRLAARRLKTPGVSIAEAAIDVGYESEVTFSRAFKKIVGASPGAWRKGRRPAPP